MGTAWRVADGSPTMAEARRAGEGVPCCRSKQNCLSWGDPAPTACCPHRNRALVGLAYAFGRGDSRKVGDAVAKLKALLGVGLNFSLKSLAVLEAEEYPPCLVLL